MTGKPFVPANGPSGRPPFDLPPGAGPHDRDGFGPGQDGPPPPPPDRDGGNGPR